MFRLKKKEPASNCDAALSASLAEAGEQEKSGGLTQKLSIAFATSAAITAVIAVLIYSLAWNIQFNTYLRNNLQGIAESIAYESAHAYHVYGGWNFSSFAVIPRVGANVEVAVQILSTDGRVVYDEASMRAHANRLNMNPNDNPAVDMLTSQPKGEVMTADISVDGTSVGTVRVWAYGKSALMSERDIQLRSSSLLALGSAGVLGVILSSIFGIVYSRQITKPINCITQAAMEIRSGNPNARTMLSGDDEISLLAETFDKMADSIQADRIMERRLTNDVAHELRTPLMAVQATVEAMEDGVLPANPENLQTVLRETKRLSRLTNAILELSRLENGTLPMAQRPILASTPVLAAIDAHSALFDLARLSVITDIDNTLVVNADPDRIQQAVGNLLSNSARYTPEEGIVSISVQRAGAFAVIEVKDSGIGMSKDDLEMLFTRFWRADTARDRASGGIGVGLSITKEIVERHGGSITVDSKPGEGATFSIYLPLGNGNA